MWITTRATYDLETGRMLVRHGYEYDGPVALCCSDSGTVEASDNALLASDTALSKTMADNAKLAFGEQQTVLGQQAAKFAYMAANPMGYTPAELHTATTSINENTATAAKQAIGAAAAFAASHGGADVGGGGAAQAAGQIASQAAVGKARSLADLSMQNEGMKRAQMWQALSGLNQVGSEYGNATGTSLGGATGASGAGTSAGTGALDAANAGWTDFGSILSGLGGVGEAVATGIACVTGETLIAMADGTERRADTIDAGDELYGMNGNEIVVEVERTANVPCVGIMTADDVTLIVSCSHTFAAPLGGYIVAADALGKILKSLSGAGTSLVVLVQDAGKRDVIRFRLNHVHGYLTNRVWSLE